MAGAVTGMRNTAEKHASSWPMPTPVQYAQDAWQIEEFNIEKEAPSQSGHCGTAEPAVLVSQNFITHQMYIYLRHIYSICCLIGCKITYCGVSTACGGYIILLARIHCLLDVNTLQGCIQPRAAASLPMLQTRPKKTNRCLRWDDCTNEMPDCVVAYEAMTVFAGSG